MSSMMDDSVVLTQVRDVVVQAIESRRGLVAFSRMEAIEMDRQARAVERDALDQVRRLVPAASADQQLGQVRLRLERMDASLDELNVRQDIQEQSRGLERDETTWRAFEDISWLLGLV